jgi:hypothetical protein
MEWAGIDAELNKRLNAFKDVLDSQIAAPPSGDERISAFASAVRDSLETPGPILEFFTEILGIKPDVGSSYLATKTLRAAQRQLYGAFPDYPRAYMTSGKWAKGLDWILEDHDRAAQFTVDIWARPLQSNVSDRYKSIKALGVLARQFGRLETFDIMDIGCSQNAGLNHLASGVGFGLPALIRPGSRSHTPSLKHTAAFHKVLNTTLELAPSLGIDIYDPLESREWAWSCSHYPSELLDERRVALFNALINADYDNVDFFKGDFAEFNTAAFENKHPGRQFGIVNFSTVLYQASELERTTMIRQAEAYARDFIVVQDFLRIDPENPRRLIFRDNWQDDLFPYRMVVRDMQDNSQHWHELFRWKDGRCQELAIGLGRIAVHHGRSSSLWRALDRMREY